MSEPMSSVPEWSVEFGPNGSIKGWLSWPDDPFYRPVIGAFARQQLIETAATARRPKPAGLGTLARGWLSGIGRTDPTAPTSAPAEEWVCFFEFTLRPGQVSEAGQDLSLQCLETGQVLHPSPQIVKAEFSMRHTQMEVSDLIKLGSYSKRHTDVAGFRMFLTLDPGDQLELVYTSLLRRRLDPGGLDAYLPILYREEQTILDVRDALLESQEFKKRGYTINDRIGGWLVWSGLREIQEAALPMSLSAPGVTSKATGDGFIGAGDFRTYAARLALRESQSTSQSELWAKQHAQEISLLRRHWETIARSRQRDIPASVLKMKLLGSMQPSSAGRRDGHIVRALRGNEGIVVAGPHLVVPAAYYRLTVNLTVDDPATPMPDSAILATIDVSYDGATLAARPISPDDLLSGEATLDFAVPHDVLFRSDRGQLDCEIGTSGALGFAVTGVLLESFEPEGDGAELNTIDWLGLMKIGSAGERDNGQSYRIKAPSGARGHVIYGPYTQLLPGEYELTLTCQNGGGGGARSAVTIDVLASQASAIEKKQFMLDAGDNTLTLRFTVDEITSEASRNGGAEFRIHKRKDSAFSITGLQTIRRPLGGG